MEIRVMRCHPLPPELDACLPELNTLINGAYTARDRSCYGAENLFSGPRLESLDQLLLEMGSSGLLAVAFDTLPDEQGSQEQGHHHPVAVAGIKPWKGRAVDLWELQKAKSALQGTHQTMASDQNPATAGATSPNDWEVSVCASRNDPQYRRQGLVMRCLDVLLQQLRASRLQSGVSESPISLWVTALEGVGNVEYWQRRGFVMQGETQTAPAGLWGAYRPFKIGTLKKTVV
jgi:hypothetical protein